jgi:hypothetical protein
MAASYVTVAQLRSNLGIGTLYSDADLESICQTSEDLLNSYLWFNNAPVVGTSISNNVATVVLANPGIFTTGQSVTISAAGSTYNGSYTLTGSFPGTTVPASLATAFWTTYAFSTYPNGYSMIQYAKTASDDPFHRILPYGLATGPGFKTAAYNVVPAVNQAAMIIAVDIFQARQVSQNGGNGMDGMSPNRYAMGYQLINRVRGLIAPYSSPNTMVG